MSLSILRTSVNDRPNDADRNFKLQYIDEDASTFLSDGDNS